MQCAVFLFVVTCALLLQNANTKRHKREKGNIIPTRTEAAEKAEIGNYSTSPVEAFFGTGAHTHSLPLQSNNGPAPVNHAVNVGGLQINNDIQLQQTQVKHQHAVAGTNGLGESTGMDWHKQMNDYRKQVNDTATAQGINPHPHYLGPNHFFGRSPFEHDTDLSGAPALSPTSGTHNIAGLNIGHSVQPSYATYTEAHNLPGVNPFGKGVNWTDHFSQVLPHHANLAGQSATATGTAVKVVNPNLAKVPSAVVPAANPFDGTSNSAQEPSTPAPAESSIPAGINPFANPGIASVGSVQNLSQPSPPSGSANPFLARWKL